MQFIGSTPDQEVAIKAAASAATDYIANAHQYLVNPPADSTGERYTTWFGQDDPQRRAHVESVFSNLASNDLETFIYDCSSCVAPVYGYTYPNQYGTIYLGPLFWESPATGTDSQAGYLIQAASQFQANGSTQEHEHGPDDCQELARVNPDNAITNADNYQYFAENNPPLA
ncbi:M35 family metallo-endopeptidase [Streptomyces roseolus]|uniref:M35 family metallo-endopeptidase n=1 Tax=Streptomyces roseolus TaxID=67358 RepID=UPI00378F9546